LLDALPLESGTPFEKRLPAYAVLGRKRILQAEEGGLVGCGWGIAVPGEEASADNVADAWLRVLRVKPLPEFVD
jgi:hypothetical protein